MAERLGGANVQALRQFVGQSPWEVEEVQQPLARKMLDLLSEPEVWILDETALPKAGQHSVGMARQYCGTLGKVTNCQVAVSLHWFERRSQLSDPVATLPAQRMVGRFTSCTTSQTASVKSSRRCSAGPAF